MALSLSTVLSVGFAIGAEAEPPATQITTLKQAQSDRLARIPGLEIMFSENGVPKFLAGETGVIVMTGSQAEMDRLLADLGPAFLARGTESLTVTRRRVVRDANVVSYGASQMIRGMPVFVMATVITARNDTGEVIKVSGGFLPDHGLDVTPTVSADAAARAATAVVRQVIGDEGDELTRARIVEGPTLGYALAGDAGVLAWEIKLSANTASRDDRLEHLLIDAMSGELIDRFPDVIVN
jgi:hypothetical protein